MDGLTLPAPDDCHVLAAALAAEAQTILTMNLRDFPDSALGPHGVTAVHPDSFLCGLYDEDPELLRASTEMAHANLSRSAPVVRGLPNCTGTTGLTAAREAAAW